jgi:hypothetical protein
MTILATAFNSIALWSASGINYAFRPIGANAWPLAYS